MRDHAERQVVGLDLVVQRELAELRHQAPVTAHDALDQPFVRQAIEAALLAVARRGREDEGEAGGMAFLQKAPLERDDQFIRRADADEARTRDIVSPSRMMAIASSAETILFLSCHRLTTCRRSQFAIPGPSKACDLPPTKTPTWPPGSANSV